jgi:hypothetical protein
MDVLRCNKLLHKTFLFSSAAPEKNAIEEQYRKICFVEDVYTQTPLSTSTTTLAACRVQICGAGNCDSVLRRHAFQASD